MRSDALINGGLVGLGVGLILASLLLRWQVGTVIPQDVWGWHLRGVAIFGGVALALGIVFEILERVGKRAKREGD